ncbi:hypothetical protein [Aurantivibrio plasticivorans]
MKPTDTGKAYDTITDRWASDRFDMHNGIDQHRRAIAFIDNRGYALDDCFLQLRKVQNRAGTATQLSSHPELRQLLIFTLNEDSKPVAT